jgi:hypothetical protein
MRHHPELLPFGEDSSWERRVRDLEDRGLTRSDAQGVADAELMTGNFAEWNPQPTEAELRPKPVPRRRKHPNPDEPPGQ